MLREKGLAVAAYPERTFATVDHIVPTNESSEPYSDPLADAMIKELLQKLRGVWRYLL